MASRACRWSRGRKLVGIVTNRDLRFEDRLDQPLRNIMTPQDRLVTMKEGATLDEAQALMHKHRLERVLIVNDAFELRGLATVRTSSRTPNTPTPARTARASCAWARPWAWAPAPKSGSKLVAAGVDVIIVDTAHGHSAGVLERVRWSSRTTQGRSHRRQYRHRRRRARWSKPAPTASRSVSARAPSAPRASWPVWACPRSAPSPTWPRPSKAPACPSSPTAASATRATSPRRWPPARSPA